MGKLNWYTGSNPRYGMDLTLVKDQAWEVFANQTEDGRWETRPVPADFAYSEYAGATRIGFHLRIQEYEGTLPERIRIYVQYEDIEGAVRAAADDLLTSTYLTDSDEDSKPFFLTLQRKVKKIQFMTIQNRSDLTVKFSVGIRNFFVYMGINEDDLPTEYTPSYKELGIEPESVVVYDSPIADITNSNIERENFTLTERLCSADRIKFGLCEAAYCEFTVVNRGEDFNGRTIIPTIKANGTDEQIPLGKFIVDSVRKTHLHGTIKKTIIAYDKLAELSQNAFNWYTSYMYALSFSDYDSRHGFEFTRQIYSSYFNIAKALGLENREDYTEVELQYHEMWTQLPTIPFLVNKYSEWLSSPIPPESPDNAQRLHYIKLTVNNPDPAKRYVVDLEQEILDQNFSIKEYTEQCDPYLRGVKTANVLIDETRTGKYTKNKFVVDSGDYFMISPTCTKFDIYIPVTSYVVKGKFDSGLYTHTVKISEVQEPIELENGWVRLMYYDWNEKRIFETDTTITARDVIHSLIEPCGAFFKLNRQGRPEFLYCRKDGLYPRNDLYPSDTLYPQTGTSLIESMAQYETFTSEDYEVARYGRIQIIKKDVENNAKSLVQWEYKGSTDRNTYLIDDNIFYCNKDMEYEYDSMAEVSEMLENMWHRISNLGYIPHTTKAKGMPFIETGDRIGLLTKTGGIESFVFERTLSGIQHLVDTYEAEGVRYNRPVAEYAYKEWKEKS